MCLRHTPVRKDGKTRQYGRWVRSVRNGRKVRQETVAFLGALDEKARRRAIQLARHFLGERVDQPRGVPASVGCSKGLVAGARGGGAGKKAHATWLPSGRR